MYTREIQAPRSSPLEKGIPLAGTWTEVFTDVNLLDIRQPYSFPYPRWLLDYQLKEWESFTVNDERFFLDIVLSNVKLYRVVHIFLYNKESKEYTWVRKLLPFSTWHAPHNLTNSIISDRNRGLFLRVHNWLEVGIIEIDINLEESRKFPACTLHLEYEIKNATPLVVSLLFSEKRPMYAYKICASVKGDMVIGRQHSVFNPATAAGLVRDCKGYYPYRMRSTWCSAVSFDTEQRLYGFNIAENQAKETYRNNENGLWVGGKLTPLPPVHITMPNGANSDWVIQDMEGMVDLIFTPQIPVHNRFDFIVACSEYTLSIGLYKGTLVDKEGNQILIHNILGFGKRLYLRV
ncbi:MAG: DUF2804 domain-containing protein [Spirochaetaceae bacterium]|jgi:hypothetical protein|nr:DUF2804 domain-containing protein [Spirochaetaceae bacterium]